jgi:hypothetical protein
MARNPVHFCPATLLKQQAGTGSRADIREHCNRWILGLLVLSMLTWTDTSQAVLLWSDLGATQVHETGAGADILGEVCFVFEKRS